MRAFPSAVNRLTIAVRPFVNSLSFNSARSLKRENCSGFFAPLTIAFNMESEKDAKVTLIGNNVKNFCRSDGPQIALRMKKFTESVKPVTFLLNKAGPFRNIYRVQFSRSLCSIIEA